MNLRSYASLADLRLRNSVDSTDTSDDPRLLMKLRTATEAIERNAKRIFQPVIATKKFDYYKAEMVDLLGNDLLSITAITNGDASAIDPAAVVAFDRGYLELDPTAAFFTYLSTPRNAISITGYWGVHNDYDSAWHGSAVKLAAGIGTTDTALTTGTNSGVDAWGKSPALSPAMLIRIDNEMMHCVAVPDTTHINVVRGANGSTAAVHSINADIYVYEAPADIAEITTRWAALLAAQDDSDFGKKTITQFGVEVPVGLPADLSQRLASYRKVRV